MPRQPYVRPRPWYVRSDGTAPSVLIYDANGKYVAEVGRDMLGETPALEFAQEIVDAVNAAGLLEAALLDAEAPKVEMHHHSEPGPAFDFTSPAGMMISGETILAIRAALASLDAARKASHAKR